MHLSEQGERLAPGWAAARFGGDLAALGGGALLPLAFAPFGIYPLAILLLALLLWLWEGVSPRRAAWRGWLFGLGAFSTGIYWIYISLHEYGNAPAPFAVLATLIVILLMALYPLVAGYALVRWAPWPGPVKWLLVAPALWTGLEWVRSWLFTGFPWLSLGYSQIDGPLAGIAPYLGVFGVSWAVMLSAGLLLLLFRSRRRMRLVWGGAFLALWAGAGGLGNIDWVSPDGEPLRVALIQGNISQKEKFEPQKLDETLWRYYAMSRRVAGQSDVVIWPETAVPLFFDQVGDFLQALQEQARQTDTDYLTGIPAGSWETGVFHNSVISVGGSQGFYHKRRLLPFGEYLPLRSLLMFFRDFVDIPMADFTPGARDQMLLRVAGQPVGVSICFEAAFGSEIRLSLPEARLLVNVSNDAWFGDSLAPHQHLQIARLRALEAGRYMARATNTGISALIDERGRITARGGQFVPETVQGPVQPLRGATPYVRIGDFGVVMLLVLTLATGLYLAFARR